jgi:hypothetical protein
MGLPRGAIREMISSAIQLDVHPTGFGGSGWVQVHELFRFRPQHVEAESRVQRRHLFSGGRIRFLARIRDLGVDLGGFEQGRAVGPVENRG